MNTNFEKIIKNFFLQTFQIIVGTAIMAVGTGLFLVQNKLSTGGFSGVGTIFYYLLNIPVGNIMLVLNTPLFIYSFLKNGKSFFFKSLIGTFSLSMFVNLFSNVKPLTDDKLLACIYGGILVGAGTALILKVNGSTGGSDQLAQIIRKYKPDIPAGKIIVGFDTCVVVISVIVFKQIEIALYSVIAIYIMGKAIDIFLEGIYFTKMIYIISDKYKKIAEEIGKEVERGTTRNIC